MSNVGKRLREERDRKRLTQVEVFTKTGVNNKTLSGYENGVSHPDFETLKTLAELYGVSTDYLLGVDEKESPIEKTDEDIDIDSILKRASKLPDEEKELFQNMIELILKKYGL